MQIERIAGTPGKRHVQEQIASEETPTTFNHRVRNDSARPKRERTIARATLSPDSR